MAKPKKTLESAEMKTLMEDIRKKTFRRVYLLYGDEDYLVRQYRDALIKAVCGDDGAGSMNLNIHRDEGLDWGQLQDEILAMPFFAEYRMVVLDDTKLFRMKRKAATKDEGTDDAGADSGAGEDEDQDNEGGDIAELANTMASFLPNIPETTVLLFTERPDEVKQGGQKGKTSVDKRSRLYKAAVKCGLAVEFSAPDEDMLKTWVLRKLGAEKIRITRDALELFLGMVGNDMSHISTETEKLISYVLPGGEVRRRDVEAVTSEILEGKIFRMIDLISQHDRKGALELYDDLVQLKEPPVKIFILTMRQLDKLLLVRSILDEGGSIGRVMEAVGQGKWQAEIAMRQARGFSGPALRKAVEECARLQEMAQSGRIDMHLGLELMILRVTAADVR